MNGSPVRVTPERDGRLLHLELARPKANIVNGAMVAALQGALDEVRDQRELAGVLLTAEGPNFSFGASVEEHLPERCKEMLRGLHHLILTMVEYPVPILVAVRGQCLGGGMELVLAGSLVFAAPDAKFAQPEIRLGVFAPAASCLLPELIGPAAARDLLWSGRGISAGEAKETGLITAIAEEPENAALSYFDEYLSGLSSSALRHAVRAAGFDMGARVRHKLAELERLYLEELMTGADAEEGLRAFMEKRTPRWEHR